MRARLRRGGKEMKDDNRVETRRNVLDSLALVKMRARERETEKDRDRQKDRKNDKELPSN